MEIKDVILGAIGGGVTVGAICLLGSVAGAGQPLGDVNDEMNRISLGGYYKDKWYTYPKEFMDRKTYSYKYREVNFTSDMSTYGFRHPTYKYFHGMCYSHYRKDLDKNKEHMFLDFVSTANFHIKYIDRNDLLHTARMPGKYTRIFLTKRNDVWILSQIIEVAGLITKNNIVYPKK